MNIKKLLYIKQEFCKEMNIVSETNLTYTIIDFNKIHTSPIWTAEYFDEKYNLFQNKFKHFKKLKEISTIEKGDEPGSINYIDYFDKEEQDIPFIKTSEIANHNVNYNSKQYISNDLFQKIYKNKTKHKIKDLLFTKDGKVGDVAILTSNDKFIFGSGIIKIRLNDDSIFTPEFIFMLLSLKEFGLFFVKKYTVRGTTIPHLRFEYISNMKIPVFKKSIIDKYTKKIRDIINYEN